MKLSRKSLFAGLVFLWPDNVNLKKDEMDKIVYKLVFDRKRALNSQGMALVQVEAYMDGRKRYFSTHVYLKPEQWDGRRKRVRSHPNAETLNRRISGFVATLENLELQLWREGRRVSPTLLKETLCKETGGQSFIRFVEHEVRDAAVKESTRRNLRSTLRQLCAFRPQILFADLTFEFVADFELFLRRQNLHTNTVAKHLKHLKQQVNAAIRKDYLHPQRHPFRDYKIKTATYRHTHLTLDELACLEQLRLHGRHTRLQKTLDAFLFCCYAGLRYSDFTSLSSDNLVNIGKEQWLIYRSVKTQTEVRLPLFVLFGGKGLAILERYADCLNDFFHLKDNSNVNKQLRLLGRMAGLNKTFSFHTARHTNATLLIYKGINITTIQKLLGHKNVKTTQVYAQIMDRTVVHDLKTHEQ